VKHITKLNEFLEKVDNVEHAEFWRYLGQKKTESLPIDFSFSSLIEREKTSIIKKSVEPSTDASSRKNIEDFHSIMLEIEKKTAKIDLSREMAEEDKISSLPVTPVKGNGKEKEKEVSKDDLEEEEKGESLGSEDSDDEDGEFLDDEKEDQEDKDFLDDGEEQGEKGKDPSEILQIVSPDDIVPSEGLSLSAPEKKKGSFFSKLF
jgi:hypothetical protein